jgi:hypothetical protein
MTFGAIYPKDPEKSASHRTALLQKRQHAQPAHVEEEDGATITVYRRGAGRGDQVVLSGRGNSTMHS